MVDKITRNSEERVKRTFLQNPLRDSEKNFLYMSKARFSDFFLTADHPVINSLLMHNEK